MFRGVFRSPAPFPGNKLNAMERPLADNSPDIEVLDGQISVEELLAELGFEWSAEPVDSGASPDASAGEPFSQPALF